MIIGIPKETSAEETRVPLIPDSVKRFTDAGAEVHVESGIGQTLGITDTEYEDAGAKVISDRSSLLGNSDIVLRMNKPEVSEISQLKWLTLPVA